MKQDNKPKVLRIINSCVLCLTLMFALMGMGKCTALEGVKASVYYGFTLLCLGVYELLSFFYQRNTVQRKSDFFRLGYAGVCLIATVCSFAIPDTSRLYVLPALLYLLVPMAKRIVSIVCKRKARFIVYNSLVLFVCGLAFLATLALTAYIKEGLYGTSPIFAYMVIIMTCLTNISSMAFSQFNKAILLRIVHKTYAGEILLGLFLLMVAFSLVLMHNEESVKNFGDALWYCFAVITTIGFGDIAAVSMVGRILTVILGVYGIIVVSILTSIIVNFYSEVKDSKDADDDSAENEAGALAQQDLTNTCAVEDSAIAADKEDKTAENDD